MQQVGGGVGGGLRVLQRVVKLLGIADVLGVAQCWQYLVRDGVEDDAFCFGGLVSGHDLWSRKIYGAHVYGFGFRKGL